MAAIEELLFLKNRDLGLDLIEEYASFRNLPFDEAKRIIDTQTLKLDPGKDIDEFYQQSDDFLINLIRAQIKMRHLNARVGLVNQVLTTKSALEVIDLGGGLGNYCIALSRSGHRCTYADIPGVIMDFAKHRFAARNLPIDIGDVRTVPDKKFQVLLSFDVLEHLEDPVSVMVDYAMHCVPNGILFLTADFMNFNEPFHLRKNFSYSFVYESILKSLGFEMTFNGGFLPLGSIIKAGTRIYILKSCSYDRDAMLKTAKDLARDKFLEYQSYFHEELKRLAK